MATLNVTGLSKAKVEFLRQLIALWRRQGSERREAGLKIRKEDLPPRPEWLQHSLEAASRSPLANLSEEEIGQLCIQLSEEAAREEALATS
jgi:hypothetical protein